MTRRFTNIKTNYILAGSTLLDPRFKKLGFGDVTECLQAAEQWKAKVASTITVDNSSQNL